MLIVPSLFLLILPPPCLVLLKGNRGNRLAVKYLQSKTGGGLTPWPLLVLYRRVPGGTRSHDFPFSRRVFFPLNYGHTTEPDGYNRPAQILSRKRGPA